MENLPSIEAVRASRWRERWVKPLYATYGFAQLPRLVQGLLSGDASPLAGQLLGPLAQRYDTVILLLVDAFGWRFWERYQERYATLRRVAQEGLVTKLTAQFPSTTAAHITTIHSGLPVGQSGVYEWFYYEPTLDAMIAPLLFSFAGDKDRNTLAQVGAVAADLFPSVTIYQALRREGVRSTVYQHQDFTPSPYSDVLFDGAAVHPYATLPAALEDLVHTALTAAGPAYHFLYFGGIDSVGHHQGPSSPQFQAEVDAFFDALESILYRGLQGKARRTLLLITADHGQADVDPAWTIYLNQTLPNLSRWLRQNRQGQLLVPAGSCRDMFLYLREEAIAEARQRLQEHLAGRADVCLVRDLIADGFFGEGAPSATFLSRVGDLVILPYDGETVWWYEPGRFTQEYFGHHGGLSPAEMETALLALPCD